MQLIKSLFCWHGFDNRPRFTVINFSIVLAFIMLNESFTDFKVGTISILLLCSSISLATARRRLNDAKFHSNLLLAPAGSFLVTGLIIIFTGLTSAYWLLLIPFFFALLLLTYPGKNQNSYILGYNGPVNLSDFQQEQKTSAQNSKRVEPTMNGINVNQPSVFKSQPTSFTDNVEHVTSTNAANQVSANAQHKLELGESIRLALFNTKYARITVSVFSLLLVLALALPFMFSSPTPITPENEKISEASEAKAKASFQHKLTLQDNFSIMIAAENAIVIHWPANVLDNQDTWTLGTAQGDKSCQEIAFNKEAAIRTYRVSAIDSGFYAYFSPLDTKALIKNIAFKNNFSLCGYSFSLKGSQATLGKSAFYANLIDY
ncbi:hypothetical protein [Cognaticolwellia beringensis]|uniref:Uncharacterized protein n=1 Tax=Cognaticolwellia beringensis TaxID=1967665 RepID=A0A222GBB3_9GAMM|nr:hypothetical protein [Cognaticolwellia beringensis]ASP49179.1 hypothetical protein B5D82_16245 [Cognaticolwellia beringensis]